MNNESRVVSIKDLFGNERFLKFGGTPVEEKAGLRGYFLNKLKGDWTGKEALSHGYLALRMQHLKRIDDYYYLKSICDKAELEGRSFAKTFWGSLKVKNF